jgi:hypothetical protein
VKPLTVSVTVGPEERNPGEKIGSEGGGFSGDHAEKSVAAKSYSCANP